MAVKKNPEVTEETKVEVTTTQVEGTLTEVKKTTEAEQPKEGFFKKAKAKAAAFGETKAGKICKKVGVAAAIAGAAAVGYALGKDNSVEASDAEVLQYFELNELPTTDDVE